MVIVKLLQPRRERTHQFFVISSISLRLSETDTDGWADTTGVGSNFNIWILWRPFKSFIHIFDPKHETSVYADIDG